MTLADSTRARMGSSTVPRLRSRRGFSLLELVVILVLVGILTAISTGKIGAMRGQQSVARAASVVQVQLEKAFAIAGRNRAPMHIVWSSSTMVLSVKNRAETLTYGSVSFKTEFSLNAGEVTADQTSIEVYPNGFASGPLTITITAARGGETYKKIVYMARSGLIKVT